MPQSTILDTDGKDQYSNDPVTATIVIVIVQDSDQSQGSLHGRLLLETFLSFAHSCSESGIEHMALGQYSPAWMGVAHTCS